MNYRRLKWGRENSISIFELVIDRQTDRQNINIIDAHILEECAEKKIELYKN